MAGAVVICVTGRERSIDALAARIAASPELMHELRLDQLGDWDDAVFELIKTHGPKLVVCLRADRQGGGYEGDESERLALLARAARAGAKYVDVEADVPDEQLSQFERDALVLSWHDFNGLPSDLDKRAHDIAERHPAVVKLAVAVTDPSELTALLDARAAIDGDAVLIGMGAGGQLSRTRYTEFGSAWTYVSAGADESTAPGQLDLDTARLMGLPATADQPFYALVGGPSVAHSPGPRVYNRLFRDNDHGTSYHAVVCRSLSTTLPLLERLGVAGLSVTMPHKQAATELCKVDALAARVGAVNSMRRRKADGKTHWEGTNSDVEGVRAPLARANAHGTALILGAGGAASAAVVAALQLGLDVRVAARRAELAAALAGDGAATWDARAEVEHNVLINATSLTGDDCPWPADTPLTAEVVFELAMGSHSRLLDEAREQRCVAIEPLAMWLHQGAQQMRWMLEQQVTVEELEACR
jgi:3-dehydroquinate dehydratase/shikimate dehydrogenase